MTPADAVARLNTALAHAWMVRTFLKHADEIQASEDMLDVPRTLYDSIRATEPAALRGDAAEFLRTTRRATEPPLAAATRARLRRRAHPRTDQRSTRCQPGRG